MAFEVPIGIGSENEQAPSVFVERTKEKREVRLDLAAVRAESAGFFDSHKLEALLKEIPPEIRLSAGSEARLREALREGFDQAMLLPSAETQTAQFEELVQEMATKEIPGLPEAEQYTEPYIEAEVRNARESVNRPKRKAYLFLYQSGPLPKETKGKRPEDIDALFAKKKWNGFTLEEYLIAQRKEAEARKDHSFDAYSEKKKFSQWSRLIDSRVEGEGAAIASWSPLGSPDVERQQVFIDWDSDDPDEIFPELGTRPAVVIEIEA